MCCARFITCVIKCELLCFMNECEMDMLDTDSMTDELLKYSRFLSDMKTAAALLFSGSFWCNITKVCCYRRRCEVFYNNVEWWTRHYCMFTLFLTLVSPDIKVFHVSSEICRCVCLLWSLSLCFWCWSCEVFLKEFLTVVVHEFWQVDLVLFSITRVLYGLMRVSTGHINYSLAVILFALQ